MTVSGILKTTDTTDSTSSLTGALRTAGGLGVKLSAYFGGDVTAQGTVNLVGSEETVATATTTCTKGKLTWSSDYVYICVSTNVWKRMALSDWSA